MPALPPAPARPPISLIPQQARKPPVFTLPAAARAPDGSTDDSMAEAAAPAPAAQSDRAQGKSNAKFYMKNAMISMVSIAAAHQIAGWISNREDPVACGVYMNDNSWFGAKRYESLRFFDPKQTHHESQYVAMSDGVDLAVDTYVANYLWDKQHPVPTVVFPTRHGRGYDISFPLNIFTQYERKFTNPRVNAYISRFVTNGYAWVSVDVRGTGASAGAKPTGDFGDQEVADGYDLVEWVTHQPWSNGEVAVFGQGVDGVGALLVAASKHPALKALSLNGAPVDVFADAFFPGGVKNAKALRDYAEFTLATDSQRKWGGIPTFKPRLMLNYFGGTVYPVDDNAAMLANYVHQHRANANWTAALDELAFRDGELRLSGEQAEAPATFQQAVDALRHLGSVSASGVAVQAMGGYYDMGSARSAILLYQYLTGALDADTAALLPPLPANATTGRDNFHRLTLGPWSHAGVDNADPFAASKQKCFYHLDEVSRFLDHHMFPKRAKITKLDDEAPVHYYSVVHSRWKAAPQWPPAHLSPRVLYLAGEGEQAPPMSDEVPRAEGQTTLAVAPGAAAKIDIVSRWDALDHLFGKRPYYYHDRAPLASAFATFLSPELPLTELTGEATLRLFFSVDRPAVRLVAYLEDVDYQVPFPNENKRRGVTYVTEALLDPVHTPVRAGSSVYSFTKQHARVLEPGRVYEALLVFQPISYVVKHRHQLRVSVGVAGPPDFESAVGDDAATELTIHFGGQYPTALSLPAFEGVRSEDVVPAEEAPEDAFPVDDALLHTADGEQDDADEFKDEL